MSLRTHKDQVALEEDDYKRLFPLQYYYERGRIHLVMHAHRNGMLKPAENRQKLG